MGLSDTFADASECGGKWEAYTKAISVVQEVAEEYKKDGWISVDDRLPEKYTHCLVTRRNKYEDGFDTDVREDVYLELEGIWDWQSKFEGLIDEIVAWQPLPKPYKPKVQQRGFAWKQKTETLK